MSNFYNDRVRGELLREWRESQNIDVCVLAGKATLSVAQIQQLELGGTALFYTEAIKENAARKVASLLGKDPADVIRPLATVEMAPLPSVVNERLEPPPSLNPEAKRWVALFPRAPWWATSWFLFSCLFVVMVWVDHTVNGVKQAVDAPKMAMAQAAPATETTRVQQPSQAIASATELKSRDNTQAEVIGFSVKGPSTETVAGAAVASRETAVNATPLSASLCQQSEPAQQSPSDTVLMPSQARKPGDMVHLVALKEGGVCVVDGAGQSTAISLKASESRSVYGPPPWRVHFEASEQVQLFFQGVRLRMPHPLITAVVLHEGAFTP
jgi:transcriptional regulator with XRE-family HTH domain